MKKVLPFLFIVFVFAIFGKSAEAQAGINISVDPIVILNEDFAQLFGGYLGQGLSPTEYTVYNSPTIRQAVKSILPQDPNHPVVMRVQSGKFTKTDSTNHVKAVISFCKEVNCDPMFGPLAGDEIGAGPGWNVTEADIREHILLVKDECRRVFGDDLHCKHWNFGNEPTSPPSSCVEFAQELHQIGRIIREYIPNAIIHTLEIYNYNTKVRGTEETIGECILRELNQKTPKLQINVLQVHWYPYSGNYDIKRRVATDGEKLLSYWEGNYDLIQSMRYPFGFAPFMKNYAQKYEISRGAEIGVGELNLSAMFNKYPQLTEMAADAVAGCTWLRDNYEPNIVPSVDGCKIPSNFETKRLNLTWGGAFWYLDELGILAEAGVKYLQRHTLVGSGAFGIIDINGERTPASYAYEFLAKNFGMTIVNSLSLSPALLNSHASLDKEGNLRLLLVNKTGLSKVATISINNFTPQGTATAYFFQVPSNGGLYFKGGDYPGQQKTPVVKSPQTDIIISGQNLSYEVPGYTSIIFKIPHQEEARIHFLPGWNDLAWLTGWNDNTDFNSLPASCQKVSLGIGDWLTTYVRLYSFSDFFKPGINYKVWCQIEEVW